MARKTLLIGSLPFPNEAQAMAFSLDQLGGSLISLPDGEIGEISDDFPKGKRAAWTMTAINKCAADTDSWGVARAMGDLADGFPATYDDVIKLKPKRPPSIMHNHLDFGYHTYFKQNYPIFQDLREQHGLSNLRFQVGVPTGLGIAFSMMSPIQALRYQDAFSKRIAFEVNEILKIAGDDVIIQVEVPAELKAAYTLPDFLMPLTMIPIRSLMDKILHGATIGIHICLGDLNNLALTQAKTLEKMVKFSNLLVDAWSSHYKLEYIHYPLAEAEIPPPTDKAYYNPLKDIVLPNETRFVAGFVHEKNTPDTNQHLLETIEAIRGTSVDIACSCGLGRRPQPIAEALIRQMKDVQVIDSR